MLIKVLEWTVNFSLQIHYKVWLDWKHLNSHWTVLSTMFGSIYLQYPASTLMDDTWKGNPAGWRNSWCLHRGGLDDNESSVNKLLCLSLPADHQRESSDMEMPNEGIFLHKSGAHTSSRVLRCWSLILQKVARVLVVVHCKRKEWGKRQRGICFQHACGLKTCCMDNGGYDFLKNKALFFQLRGWV